MSSDKFYKDKVFQSFLVILGAVIMLSAVSLLNGRISLFGWQPKNVRLFSDLFSRDSDAGAVNGSPVASSTSGKAGGTAKPKVLCQVEPYKGLADYTEGGTGLNRFMGKLAALKSKGGKVRIAYFGDSMIEGDLLTSDLRSMFQENFGGKGVGFVPITSVVASFRSTIRHTFYSGWTEYDFNSNERKSHRISPSGHVFVVGKADTVAAGEASEMIEEPESEEAESPWVTYQSSKANRFLSRFFDVRLFYGNASDTDSKLEITLDKEEPKQVMLDGASSVNSISVNGGVPIDKVSLSFSSKGPLDIFGCSFESDSGVFIDNFSFRGSSGAQLASLPVGVTNRFDELMGYDLVVLEYGLNVSDENTTDVSWYVANMTKSVNHIRACFPNADILLISVPDKGYKNDYGEVATQPSLPLLVEGQRTIAKKTGVVFWDLYSAMGGYNTMKSWAEATPPLATKDYTHINQIGARKVAKLLFEELMKKYASYAQ